MLREYVRPLRAPPLAGGALPLRDKVRLSESSISKDQTAFLCGQILQPHCVRQRLARRKENALLGHRSGDLMPSLISHGKTAHKCCFENSVLVLAKGRHIVDRAFPLLSFRPERVARSGEISERQRRTKGCRPHHIVRFLDCARNDMAMSFDRFFFLSFLTPLLSFRPSEAVSRVGICP